MSPMGKGSWKHSHETFIHGTEAQEGTPPDCLTFSTPFLLNVKKFLISICHLLLVLLIGLL